MESRERPHETLHAAKDQQSKDQPPQIVPLMPSMRCTTNFDTSIFVLATWACDGLRSKRFKLGQYTVLGR